MPGWQQLPPTSALGAGQTIGWHWPLSPRRSSGRQIGGGGGQGGVLQAEGGGGGQGGVVHAEGGGGGQAPS